MVSNNIHAWYDFFDDTQLYILVNNDITFGYPLPLHPNVISVQGLTIDEAKPLSKGNLIRQITEIHVLHP